MLYDTHIVSTITFYDIMQIITLCSRAKKPRRILLKDFSIVVLKLRDVKTIIHFWFYTLFVRMPDAYCQAEIAADGTWV